MGRKRSSTIRARLTLLYAGAFFLAGAILIAVLYFQLDQVIGQQLGFRRVFVEGMINDDAQAGGAIRVILPRDPASGLEVVPFQLDRDAEAQDVPDTGYNLVSDIEAQLSRARAATVQRLLLVSVFSLLAVGLIAGVSGWVLTGQALSPLRRITATARRVADHNLQQRIALEGPQDEIKDLADTLDSMLDRLHKAFDSQQRFIANASHELRTPLAINRTLIEVALLEEQQPTEQLRQLAATLLAVNERHEKLIDGLLVLTSSEHLITDPQPLELAEIVRHVAAELCNDAESANVKLHLELAPAPAMGDPILLERLIHNLVDNAIRYNLAHDGYVRVVTGADRAGTSILVENTGPTVASYEIGRLFEPFRRLSTTERTADQAAAARRRGAGLGLSIVQSVAAAHGGDVTAVARGGGGLSISVAIPGMT
jgi:signal transduction histidine kinase